MSETQPKAPFFPVRPLEGVEIWIGVIVGLALLMFGWNFVGYAVSAMGGEPFHSRVIWQQGPMSGQEVGYWQLESRQAWWESALFVEGLALLLLAGGSLSPAGRLVLVKIAVVGVLVTVGYNLLACALMLKAGVMPIQNLIAVGYGGYVLFLSLRDPATR